jgi:hypothetical protein
MDWKLEASAAAQELVAKLRSAAPNESVVVKVGRDGKAFACLVGEPREEGFCSVNPVVWGRDPEEFTVDDFRRALAAKKSVLSAYRSLGTATLLLLEFESTAWPGWALEQLWRASQAEDMSPYDEVFLILTAWTPAFLMPLAIGGSYAESGALADEYVDLRSELEARPGHGAA